MQQHDDPHGKRGKFTTVGWEVVSVGAGMLSAVKVLHSN